MLAIKIKNSDFRSHISHHDPPKSLPRRPEPGCMCGKPLMIVIQPGEHIHPCSVHPNHTIYGRNIYWS